ncbi:MAG: DUF983 domain-containing protein [Rhizobiales bacterium]|nr:DUF983 domain-containing protein [Hyphomicrobiales bacterium]
MSMTALTSDPRTFKAAASDRPTGQSMWRGFKMKCPACGKGRLFARFLKATPECTHCHTDLTCHEADDAPPYFTILIVGHIVVPLMLFVELEYLPPIWVHMVAWPALTLGLTVYLLPRIKGAVIGWQWALRMAGFGDKAESQL